MVSDGRRNLIRNEGAMCAGISPDGYAIGEDISGAASDISTVEIFVAEIQREHVGQKKADPNGELPSKAVRRSSRRNA